MKIMTTTIYSMSSGYNCSDIHAAQSDRRNCNSSEVTLNIATLAACIDKANSTCYNLDRD